MHRSRITARCCPALLIVLAAACATRGSTTNVSSPGDVTRDTAAAMPAAPAAARVELAVADAPAVGVYVTDATGRAVYVIETSDSVAVTCVDMCATEFEPIIGTAMIAAGTTVLEASLLGTRALPDGRQQVTYNGKPLYFFRADAAKGDTKGQGTKSYGNARLLTPKK